MKRCQIVRVRFDQVHTTIMVMHGRVIGSGWLTPRTVCIKMFCAMCGKVICRMGETRSLLCMHIGRHQQIAE